MSAPIFQCPDCGMMHVEGTPHYCPAIGKRVTKYSPKTIDNAGLDSRVKELDERIEKAYELINYLSRRVDRLLYLVDKLHRGEKVEIGERE